MHLRSEQLPITREELHRLPKAPLAELIPHLNRDQLLEFLKRYFLDQQGVMFITGLSRTTIWKLVKSGKLKPCQNTGRRLLFTLDAILECFQPSQFR
jgi:predicted DNA-binding transcriptional regulator AlpA